MATARGTTIAVDKYARDAGLWRDNGYHHFRASLVLFRTGDPFLWFSAAVLGHLALEMSLKAVLIHYGMIACDPGKAPNLDNALGLTKDDCVWGHNLVKLAQKLAEKRKDFDLNTPLACFIVGETGLVTVRRGYEIFDPFFSELRYPHRAEKVDGLGECHGDLLTQLYVNLEPFLGELAP